MRRGTNPIIKIELNIDVTLITEGYVTFKQDGVVVEKAISECTCEESCVKVQLTQRDTLKFDAKKPVQLQARLKLSDGTICATDILKLTIYDILKDGEI